MKMMKKKKKYVNPKINGHIVKLLLYTGSDISFVNEQTWKKIDCPSLKGTKKIGRGVSGIKLNFKGEFSCNVSFAERTFKSKIYVLPDTSN